MYQTFGYILCRMFEVVETAVTEDEPPPLPVLPGAALLDQPTLLVWGEEGEHQVIIGLVRDLERLLLDVVINGRQHLPREVSASINPVVLSDELLLSDAELLVDVLVVESGVEHDHGEGEDVDGVAGGEGARVVGAVMLSEGRHDPVNLLGLPRESEAPEELSQGLNHQEVREVVKPHEVPQDGLVEIISTSQVTS